METKTVTVPPERLERWLAGFIDRHGRASDAAATDEVRISAADGAEVYCQVPFPPLVVDDSAAYGGLVDHALVARRVGVVLVRRGGYAVGVFDGDTLVVSKVGSRYVQGRTAAGGQSQQRFARRRQKQAREAFEAAADVAARVVLPHADSLDALVLGGDRAAVDNVMDDPRLRPLRSLAVESRLAVPDPKLAVLKSTPARFRAVRIRVTEP